MLSSRVGVRIGAGILAAAVLTFCFAQGGVAWPFGFVALVPWLRTLDGQRTLTGVLLNAWAMSVAFTAVAFPWFGSAIGHYTQIGTPAGLAVLLVAAPVFQPQFFAFVVARHWARRRFGVALGALAGAAAWVATEWWVPKILGDTYGYGLYPSTWMRQAADLGGTAGLTVLLLLVNEAVAAAWARRADGARALVKPLLLAALVPLFLAGYGAWVLSSLAVPSGKPLRVALVQSNIAEYERLRREKGGDAVVREVLDTHYAMSYDAVERHQADAVLWSETVYPTTFAHPKSVAGAELDSEILEVVDAAKVPFVFGTYDRDDNGEYNAAAFVNPGTGLLGFYRKTHLFPFTEYLPAWLDHPVVRGWLPWAGAWQPGNGARVFPLRLADGREIPVVPLICRDDVDTRLAIDGARLGGQALLTMSNDAWFTAAPQGARVHQAAAAFRSIETRLPQFRVTTTGYSAAIDSTGTVVAGTKMGERTLVIGDLLVAQPTPTLMVLWGDWVGRAAAVFLVLLMLVTVLRAWERRRGRQGGTVAPGVPALPVSVAVLPPAARWVAGALRAFARGSLLWIAAAFLFDLSPWSPNTLAQIRLFSVLFVLPELLAWLLLRAYRAQASVEEGQLVLSRGKGRLTLPLQEIVAVEPWRVPTPGTGVWLRRANGERWPLGLTHAHPVALAEALVAAGAPLCAPVPSRAWRYAMARMASWRGRLQQPLVKFVLLPLLLAIPAFRVHQLIVYGASFGEYHAFGLRAFLSAFALWWAAWTIAVLVCAAVLRAVIEAGTLASVWLRPGVPASARRWLERLGLVVLYLGIPLWLLMRTVGS